jgi:hypothetical protein
MLSNVEYRWHRRFGVRRSVSLGYGEDRVTPALLIELSMQGCRVSEGAGLDLGLDEVVTVRIDGFEELEGHVRWARGGCIGLRFVRPLHTAALEHLLDFCRPPPLEAEALRSYGT